MRENHLVDGIETSAYRRLNICGNLLPDYVTH